jgi:hypothetical protein
MGTVLRFGPDGIAAPDDYCMLDLGKARDRTDSVTRGPSPRGADEFV